MDDYYLYLYVENNTLTSYDFEHNLEAPVIAHPAEHVNSFLVEYNIVPTYIDPNYTYGWYDEVNESWTGMIGHVNLNISPVLDRYL